MATTPGDPTDQATAQTDTRIRAGGAWLAIGAIAFIASLLLHAEPAPDPAGFMANIAAAPTQWVIAHWLAAIAATLFVIAGLLVLTADSRLTQQWWTVTAWAVVTVGSLWIVSTALIEATVVTAAAVGGDTATFVEWQRFGQALAMAFVALTPAVALIALNEARTGPATTPVWASWLGAIAGLVAGVAFALLVGVGVAMAGIVWIPATLVMSVWVGWFGVSLARADGESLVRTPASGTTRGDIG